MKRIKVVLAAVILWAVSLPAVFAADLTQGQLQTVKAAIQADPALSAQPMTPDGAFAIAAALNQPSAPADPVWRTEAPSQAVIDAVNWSQYTPVDAPDGTATYTNRVLAIQVKQMNLQLMLQGRDTIDASRANIRAGLRDAVIQVPAGAAGASVSPGGASGQTVLNALTRNALRIESILATGTATTGAVSAKIMGREGEISYQDIELARSLP